MKFLTTIMLVLSLGSLAVNSAFAAVISNGSSGELRPTSDFTLDLSGSTVPQFSNIFIDAGIRLTILTPTGGSLGNLLAANDIFVNGIIDAGSGNLGLLAGNQIVLGTGSQVITGSLDLLATTVLNFSTLSVTGGTVNARASAGSIPVPRGSTPIEGTLSISSGSDSIQSSVSAPTNLIGQVRGDTISIGGTISIGSGSDPIGSGADLIVTRTLDPILTGVVVNPVPEPSTVLLLLPGLALIAVRKLRQTKYII